ncbi:MAG: aminoglycoside phosphotransferase [Chloroflexota bacterium]
MRYGVDCHNPAILQDSNHTVVHLAPAPLVAKVGTSPEEASLRDEVIVALFLSSKSGPVVPPTSLFPPGPYVEDGLEMTFWEYCPHGPDEPSADVLGQSLRRLHDTLANYPEQLRPWDRFDGVDRVLFAQSSLGALAPDDREFLRRRHTELLSAISTFRPTVRPLHGEPHAGNLLLSTRGPRWIDFESACLGPQEWDLTVMPDEVVTRYFDHVDMDFLRVLRQMRSLCVSVWCWLDPDRAPVLREAGTYHLAVLRDAAPS